MIDYPTRKTVVLLVVVLLQVLYHPAVLAIDETNNGNDSLYNGENMILVKSDSKEITSLSDLKDGVYAIRLSTRPRAGCGARSNNGSFIN